MVFYIQGHRVLENNLEIIFFPKICLFIGLVMTSFSRIKKKREIEIGNRGKYMTGHLTGDEVGHSLCHFLILRTTVCCSRDIRGTR